MKGWGIQGKHFGAFVNKRKGEGGSYLFGHPLHIEVGGRGWGFSICPQKYQLKGLGMCELNKSSSPWRLKL